MNREIRFRGKRADKLDDNWVYGYLIIEPDGSGWIDHFPDGNRRTTEVILETVSQFTGLTDRKGNKVFEGDIVVDEALNKGVVVWLTDAAQFLCDFGMDYHDIGTWATVIGNQFDNPELIQQS